MLSATISYASDWSLSKETKGVTVYTRAVEGSDFLEFKGETIIKQNLASLVSLLWTVEDMPGWMFGCIKAEVKENTGDLERKLYLLNDAPFPLKHRDLVIENRVTQDPDTLVVTYSMDMVPAPLETSHVHVKAMKGFVSLVPISENETRVIYQAHLDPAGIVPSWAANMFVNDNPVNTLLGAKKILKKKTFAEYPGIINFSS